MPNRECKEKAVYVISEAQEIPEPHQTFYTARPYEGLKRCGDSDLEGRAYYCYKCEKYREALQAGYAARKKRIQDYAKLKS
jgi:hypothetical protein